MTKLQEVVGYLDSYLRIKEVPDDANALNGLQVENSGTIERIVAAVDASQATIDGAWKQALLLVHHGMFWDGHGTVTGRRHRKLRALYDKDTALYSAHIPLDLHPEVGNNVVLARRLGITEYDWFGMHKGVLLGVAGTAPAPLRKRDALVPAVATALQIEGSAVKLIAGGPAEIGRIGIITGGAGSAIARAKEAGCDTFITGEGAAHTYFDAMELGINVIYAGHYATETVGVQALAEQLSDRFKLPWEFHHHPTGL
ncbi:MAG TPA: Nif3-like dinuclear metal center hexameric protein [Gemmatimonadales bacterium]|nr:Nif3-like dinuclear metal center hexameric protein [Gemmatimonadales bacterium]